MTFAFGGAGRTARRPAATRWRSMVGILRGTAA